MARLIIEIDNNSDLAEVNEFSIELNKYLLKNRNKHIIREIRIEPN